MGVILWLVNLVYFMLPAYGANMAPVVSRYFGASMPLDFGMKVGGIRLLGAHKTVLGTVFGIVTALVIAFVQKVVFMETGFGLVDYSQWIRIGLLLGGGALIGDAVKSCVKRRMHIPAGTPWVPFDQLDFVIGALIFVSLIYFPGWGESIAIIVMSVLGHVLVNHSVFFLGVRQEKW